MELSFTTRPHGDITVLEVSGEVDVATAPQLRTRLIELTTQGCRSVAIDFTSVSFIDSTGLGVLVGARRRLAEAGGVLDLVVPDGHIRELFAITGLDGVFTIVASVGALGGR